MSRRGRPPGRPRSRRRRGRAVRGLALALLVALAACSESSGEIDRTFDLAVAGDDRTFDLFIPVGVSPPVPLVVVFHGFTSNPSEVRRMTGLDAVAREFGFAVAYPRALGLVPAWRAAPSQGDADLAFFAALVAEVDAVIPVDPDAVLVAGFSNGGGMAVRIACEAPEAVAGVAAVAAAIAEPPCPPDRAVPLLAFHGTGDEIVPYAGTPEYLAGVEAWVTQWAAAAGCGSVTTVPAAADVTVHNWEGCQEPVTLYEVAEGGHGWPGSPAAPSWGPSTASIDASRLIAEFLEGLRPS